MLFIAFVYLFFSEAMVIGCEVFHNLKKVIKSKFGGDATLIGKNSNLDAAAWLIHTFVFNMHRRILRRWNYKGRDLSKLQ
jgi:hypothetical protein